uniref:Ig-like domain-containing protein n=1 Tax=Panthera leo TaxID=9689 RepID=A0A8C8WLG1_PANLE
MRWNLFPASLLTSGSLRWSSEGTCFFPGTAGEEFQVNQPEGSVSVRAGDIVTLACNVSAHSPAGPVLWFRKNGPEQQLIYSFNGSHFPRVNQVENTEINQTDYSIRISDVSPKDTGTYYCVKLTIGHPDMAYVSGSGTYVSVNGEYSLHNSTCPFLTGMSLGPGGRFLSNHHNAVRDFIPHTGSP